MNLPNKKKEYENEKEEKTITIQDNTNIEGCSQIGKEEANTTFLKDLTSLNPNKPQDTDDNTKNLNNENSNSIGHKNTDDDTNKMVEESDDMNLPEQNLQDEIENKFLNESNQPKKNEKDCIKNPSSLIKIETISKNGKKRKLSMSKSTPIFKVIYDYNHNFNINDVIKDESDGILFFLSMGSDFIYNRGRIPNILKDFGAKGKHDNKSTDNEIKKVLNSFKNEVDAFVHEFCKKKPYGLEIQSLNISIGSNKEDYQKFFDKKLIDIYDNFIPKNIGRTLNEERKKEGEKFVYDHNKIRIHNRFNRERGNELYTLFNKVSFGDMLEAYFDNNKNEIVKDGVHIKLDNFKRYNDCLNNSYNDDQKDKYRTKISNIKKKENKKKA